MQSAYEQCLVHNKYYINASCYYYCVITTAERRLSRVVRWAE